MPTRHVRHAIALFLVIVLGSGCSSWRRIAPPSDGFRTSERQKTRLTLEPDKRIEVRGLTVQGDSLYYLDENGDSTAIAQRQAVGYELKKFNALNTVIFVAVTGLVMFYGSLFYLASTGAFDFVGPGRLGPTHDQPPSARP